MAQRPVGSHGVSRGCRSHTNWNRAWERPFCVPRLLSLCCEPRDKGAILSRAGDCHLRLAVPGGGGIRVSIHYPPPKLLGPLGLNLGEWVFWLCCYVNHPTPHLSPAQRETALALPPGRAWASLGIFPREPSFLAPRMHMHHPLFHLPRCL